MKPTKQKTITLDDLFKELAFTPEQMKNIDDYASVYEALSILTEKLPSTIWDDEDMQTAYFDCKDKLLDLVRKIRDESKESGE